MEYGTPDSLNLAGYDENKHDYYFPLFTIIEFVFFFGWLKVAETLINPFGDDDDDFNMSYIVDRNFQLSYLMVEMDKDKYNREEDTYGGKIPPATLPHTATSFAEEYSDPITLTKKTIRHAEEEAKDEDEKPLFHIPETPSEFHLSRENSLMSLNGIGRFDILKSVLSAALNGIGNDGMEAHLNDDMEANHERTKEE